MAAVALAGGTQEAAAVVVGPIDDYQLQGTITPTVALEETYVAAIYLSGSTISSEITQVGTSVASGTPLDYLIDLDDVKVDGGELEGYTVLARYSGGLVMSFTPANATSIFAEGAGYAFDDGNDGYDNDEDLSEGSLAAALDDGLTLSEVDFITTFVNNGVDYGIGTLFYDYELLVPEDTAGDLISWSAPTAAGSVTGNVVPEPTTGLALGLGALCLTLRRRRRA